MTVTTVRLGREAATWSSSATAWPARAPSRRSSSAAAATSSGSPMFGDEPYGNYNRIMLSPRAGRRGAARTTSSSTALTGTPRTASPCTPASGSSGSTGSRKMVYGDDGTIDAVRQADHRHRQPRRSSRRWTGMRTDDDDAAARASSGSAPSTTPARCSTTPPRRRTAVVIGGGLLGLEAARGLHAARARRARRARPGRYLMNQQLDAEAGGDPRARSSSGSASTVHTGKRDHRDLRRRTAASSGVGVRRRQRDRLRHGRASPPASGRTSTSASSPGCTVERGDRRRRPDAHRGRPRRLRRRRVRPAPRRGLRPGRAAVGAGRGARRPRHRRRTRRPPTTGRGSRRSSRSPASTWPSMGVKGPERDDDEYIVLLRAASAASTSRVVIRDGKLIGATLLGDIRRSRS